MRDEGSHFRIWDRLCSSDIHFVLCGERKVKGAVGPIPLRERTTLKVDGIKSLPHRRRCRCPRRRLLVRLESLRDKWKGTLHGFEIPYTFNFPAAHVGDKVTDADKAMGVLTSGYWVAFGKTGDPNGDERPEWPRHDPSADRVINFTNDGVVVIRLYKPEVRAALGLVSSAPTVLA